MAKKLNIQNIKNSKNSMKYKYCIQKKLIIKVLKANKNMKEKMSKAQNKHNKIKRHFDTLLAMYWLSAGYLLADHLG